MGTINGINFNELESEKYWSFPKNYKGDKKELIRNYIMSGEYLGAVKKDGAYYRFVKDMDGKMALQGRNRSVSGEFLNKISYLPHLKEFFQSLPNGTCLLGEVYFNGREGSHNVTTIMGCKPERAVERQKDEKLSYYIFDVWAYDGKSFLETRACDRFNKIKEISTLGDFEYVEFAEYYKGKELWEVLQTTLALGGEGIVMTKENSSPQPGKRTARKTLKVKKEVAETLDVVIIGANSPTKEYKGKSIATWTLWENLNTGTKLKGYLYRDYMAGLPIIPITKTYYQGWAGSLIIGAYDSAADKVVPIGSLSGLPDIVLADWKNYVGKVAEITCMEVYEETRGLRHPKFLKWRDDKKPKDCEITSIFGGK